MAIYTKLGEKLLNGSLRVDKDCIYDGEIVKVWGTVEGETTERHYWYSDLRGDKRHEVRDVVNANLKNRLN
jgi:hypothetical protein